MPRLLALRFSDLDMPCLYDGSTLENVQPEEFVIASRNGEQDIALVAGIEYRASAHLALRPEPYPAVLRKATSEESSRWREHRQLERRALILTKEKAREHNLPIKISHAQFSAAQGRMLIHFTSDQRVDFRILVRDLAAMLKYRVELWQIGVRDEARLIDGFGVCGQQTCCSTFLTEFRSISVRMARDQDINLPPGKLTGQCGRFLCCLSYEVDQYRDLSKAALPKGATVTWEGKQAVILDRNLIAGTYLIRAEDGTMKNVGAAQFHPEDVRVPEQMRRFAKDAAAGEDTPVPDDPEGIAQEDRRPKGRRDGIALPTRPEPIPSRQHRKPAEPPPPREAAPPPEPRRETPPAEGEGEQRREGHHRRDRRRGRDRHKGRDRPAGEDRSTKPPAAPDAPSTEGGPATDGDAGGGRGRRKRRRGRR